MSSARPEVGDDDSDFYGKQYWLSHQSTAFGYPDIHGRARNDLTERNLHWLRTLLKYRLPPARVVELGCSHGSFVALLSQAGFAATGVEMSPWVVEFGKREFGADIRVGPVEVLDFAAGEFDVIALMDVLEHLPDPVATMAHCLRLLKPDGVLLLQTPEFKADMDYGRLCEEQGAFLEQLKADEHLYLFSRDSIVSFFAGLGAAYVNFEPAIFDRYDMFVAVSRTPLTVLEPAQAEAALLASPGGRICQALLDLRARELALSEQLAAVENDRAARGEQIATLTGWLQTSEADRAARGEQLSTLDTYCRQLSAECETLRTQLENESGAAVDAVRQTEQLQARLQEVELDRAKRNEQIVQLTERLTATEADRAARGEQLAQLTEWLHTAEADRNARGEQIAQLTEWLRATEADRAARGDQLAQLTEWLHSAEADRNARGEQIAQLTEWLHAAEADRNARGKQIEELTAWLNDANSEVRRTTGRIDELTASMQDMECERHGLLAELERMRALLELLTAEKVELEDRCRAMEACFGALRARPAFRLLTRIHAWPELEELSKKAKL